MNTQCGQELRYERLNERLFSFMLLYPAIDGTKAFTDQGVE
jgi:hypothetical protein